MSDTEPINSLDLLKTKWNQFTGHAIICDFNELINGLLTTPIYLLVLLYQNDEFTVSDIFSSLMYLEIPCRRHSQLTLSTRSMMTTIVCPCNFLSINAHALVISPTYFVSFFAQPIMFRTIYILKVIQSCLYLRNLPVSCILHARRLKIHLDQISCLKNSNGSFDIWPFVWIYIHSSSTAER